MSFGLLNIQLGCKEHKNYHTGKYLAVPFHPGSAISRGRPTMSCMSMLKAMCSKPTCTNWYVKNRQTCNLIIN